MPRISSRQRITAGARAARIYNGIAAEAHLVQSYEAVIARLSGRQIGSGGINASTKLCDEAVVDRLPNHQDLSVNANTYTGPCHLLNLPPELRLIIYEHALRKPYILILSSSSAKNVTPSLARASKQIRKEALPVHFACNSFSMPVEMRDLDRVAEWLLRLVKVCGRRPFGNFQFQVLSRSWRSLRRMRAVCKLIARETLDLDLSAIDTAASPPKPGYAKPSSLFKMSPAEGGFQMQLAMEEAMLLAVRAREHRWTNTRLCEEFDVLISSCWSRTDAESKRAA